MARAQNGPGKTNSEKLKIGIVGAGLAGMVAAMDLVDAGHEVPPGGGDAKERHKKPTGGIVLCFWF